MLTKPAPPINLHILHALQKRKFLDNEEQSILFNLQQGYQGELILATLLERHLSAPVIPLYGLQLESKGKEFQIDCLLICNDIIYLLDAKHFYGDYIIHNDRWYYSATKKEINNPLDQLRRCELLLKKFLEKNNYKLPVKSYLVFTNPEFYLYNASYSLPAIFPNQHQRFMKQLNSSNSGPISTYHNDIAVFLKQSHITRSRHEYNIKYDINEIRTGLFCNSCPAQLVRNTLRNARCRSCGTVTSVETAVMHNISDYQLLFPEKTVNTENIFAWINGEISRDSLARYMKKNFHLVHSGKSSYYTTTN